MSMMMISMISMMAVMTMMMMPVMMSVMMPMMMVMVVRIGIESLIVIIGIWIWIKSLVMIVIGVETTIIRIRPVYISILSYNSLYFSFVDILNPLFGLLI